MIRRIAVTGTALLLAGGMALADFQYEQTSKITGGALMGMVRVMGAFSKQMREPMKSTIAVKGDRMVMIMDQSTQVIDLSKETITEINHQKKQYSVVTFADWAAALQNMDNKIRDEKGKERGEITVRAKVDQPGDTRDINGMTTKHAILTMEFEGTNDKGEKGVFMTMVSDMWLAPEVAGYAEVKSFHQRMAQKLSWSPNSGFLAAAAPGSSKGMAELIKEASKLDGVPVLQVMRMVSGTPEQAAAMAQQQQAQQQAQEAQQQPPQQQTVEVEKPSVGGALGRLGGRLGGFGRRRQQQEQPAQNAPAAGGGQQGGAPGSLMDITSELTGFSQGAVDGSKFEVPGGYKQVESETLKNMKRR